MQDDKQRAEASEIDAAIYDAAIHPQKSGAQN